MGFDNKHYPNRKDHRKPYFGRRNTDRSCRSHGGCPCNHKHVHKKRELSAEEQESVARQVGISSNNLDEYIIIKERSAKKTCRFCRATCLRAMNNNGVMGPGYCEWDYVCSACGKVQ